MTIRQGGGEGEAARIPDDEPRLQSRVLNDEPRLQSRVLNDGPRLQSRVLNDEPCLQSRILDDASRAARARREPENPRDWKSSRSRRVSPVPFRGTIKITYYERGGISIAGQITSRVRRAIFQLGHYRRFSNGTCARIDNYQHNNCIASYVISNIAGSVLFVRSTLAAINRAPRSAIRQPRVFQKEMNIADSCTSYHI